MTLSCDLVQIVNVETDKIWQRELLDFTNTRQNVIRKLLNQCEMQFKLCNNPFLTVLQIIGNDYVP